ncbi:MAG: hypothetical protein H6815_04055 [Phycisphaeraceae bacterium]|nr:hypothetical protein [Phycisphaerales bacterium]MCB9859604.1 hypothetical protein [Phycisphaeraceae bacterium]
MGTITFRTEVSKDDWQAQFALWQRATNTLSRCWPSSLRNARSLHQSALKTPGSRIYAELDGKLVGYIGWHPPFAWEGLGTAVPFGYPWTDPHDNDLAAELYARMIPQLVESTREDPPDVLIQRFRSSWPAQRAFMRDRGWTDAWRQQIWSIDTAGVPTGLIGDAPVEAVDAYLIAARLDPYIKNPPTRDELTQQYRNGWIDMSMLRVVREEDTIEHTEMERRESLGVASPIVGAFNCAVNGLWAEGQLFACDAKHAKIVHATAQRCARLHGATEYGFVMGRDDEERIRRLHALGYDLRDADVYMTCRLDDAVEALKNL